MRTSTFLYDVILGVTASRMFARNRGNILNSLTKGTGLGRIADAARDKVMDMTGGTGSGSSRESGSPSSGAADSKAGKTGNQHGVQASNNSKAANLKQVKDFIRSNPDVKHEVEQILKETHTVVPGL